MRKTKEQQNKKKDEVKFLLLSNENMACKDCVHKPENDLIVGFCEVYRMKPCKVLDGGECKKYKKRK